MRQFNRYKDINITYVFGDQQESLPGLEAVKWIDGVSGSTVQVNQQKVAEYVKYLADKYDTYGKPHTFTSTSGRQVSVNGDYGWQINQAEEAVALTRMCRTAPTRPGNRIQPHSGQPDRERFRDHICGGGYGPPAHLHV